MNRFREAMKELLATAPVIGLAERDLYRMLGVKGRHARACLQELEVLAAEGGAHKGRGGRWHAGAGRDSGRNPQPGTRAGGRIPPLPRRGQDAPSPRGAGRSFSQPATRNPQSSQPATPPATLEGALVVTAGGSGFVSRTDDGPDLFIPPQYLLGAMSGDYVQVCVTEPDNPQGPAGRITAILRHRQEAVVGECRREKGRMVFRPLRRDLPESIPLTAVPRDTPAPAAGNWFAGRLVRPQPGAAGPAELRVEVLNPIGRIDSVEHTLDAVMEEFGIPAGYSAGDAARADQLRPRPDLPIEDLTGLDAFTMDPVDAKDYDDGLSVQPGSGPDRILVGIHIADVAAYITPGSWLDAEAARRGFTSYLPGRTMPMLPHTLSGDRCSLVPHEPRLAHTVFIEFSRKDGKPLSYRRCHGWIRSRARLTYEEGQAFIDGQPHPKWPAGVIHAMTELAALARVLRQRRGELEQYVDLAAPEFRIRCGGQPLRVLALERKEPIEANTLIEEYMLAANAAVAEETARRRLPSLYRVHDAPDPKDLEQFRGWFHDTFGETAPRFHGRASVNDFLHGVIGGDEGMRTLVMQEFLRSLPRAAYSAKVQPHFGLGKACYSHFTSPIRRYADTLVHQQLTAADTRTEHRPAAEMTAQAITVSETEEKTDSAYFACADRLKLHFLRDRLAERPDLVLDGLASRRTADGLLVYISSLSLMGLVPEGGGRLPDCGAKVQVRPETLDPVRGRLELRLVGEQTESHQGRNRRSREWYK